MVRFNFVAVMMAFIASSPLMSLSVHQSSNLQEPSAAIISEAPSSSAPFADVSPDIAPLLPSPSAAAGSSSVPTIPSNPSDNPDETLPAIPDSALAPSQPLPASSAVSFTPTTFVMPSGLLLYFLSSFNNLL